MVTLPVLSNALHLLRARAQSLETNYSEPKAVDLLAAVSNAASLLSSASHFAIAEAYVACMALRHLQSSMRKLHISKVTFSAAWR